MVCELGMSDIVGPLNYTAPRESNFLGREFSIASDIAEDTLSLINKEIRRICDEQYERARDLLASNRRQLDTIAESLLKYETLNGDELAVVIRGDDLDAWRASRKRNEQPKPKPLAAQGDEVSDGDVGLSGAEGLAHP